MKRTKTLLVLLTLLVQLLAEMTTTVWATESSEVLEGPFGRVEVTTSRPALSALILRNVDGALEAKSLLSPGGKPWRRGVPSWGEQGYTYVVDTDGRRYESRLAPAEKVISANGRLVLEGVKLSADPKGTPVATERWILTTEGDALAWTVERMWQRKMSICMEGTPSLYTTFRRVSDTDVVENATTHTLWVNPSELRATHEQALHPAWPSASDPWGAKVSPFNSVVLASPDTWAVAKLWTSWDAQSDLRLGVEGGHLFRRGFFGWIGELGAVASPDCVRTRKAGDVERVTLRLSPLDKFATGYQLVASIPDRAVERTLRSFYGSLLNGGVVNDQKHYNFGNETDGWYYDGSTWMQGLALSAGVPAAANLSERPLDVATAFRRHLASIAGTLDTNFVGNFGYDWPGLFVDARLNNVIGAREYLLHTGDLPFIRQLLPDLEGSLDWFLARCNERGLFDLGTCGHWYYDAMPTSGMNANHNALLYEACLNLAEMERAAERPDKAAEYEAVATQLRDAFNTVLWIEDAPGGARYCDWIAHNGEKVTYAADVCQFPPLAFGIATPDRAKRLLATLDARIHELAKDHGYTGRASLSAFWPVPDHINNTLKWQQKFPVYMNGGSFLAVTYYEIMARLRTGDTDGAWERLRRFTDGIARDSGSGNNWVTMQGRVAPGIDEPYLSDMVVVPAVLIRGFLGVRPTWDKLFVEPRLPKNWTHATAEVLYKGERHRIVVENGKVTIAPLGRAFPVNLPLTWEIRPAMRPEWVMEISRHWANGTTLPTIGETVDTHYGQFVSLRRFHSEDGLLGLWRMDTPDATVQGTGVVLGQHSAPGGTPAATLDGHGDMVVTTPDKFAFPPTQSFTVQCWFKTDTHDTRVMLSRPDAFGLYVKDGKLVARLTQDGGQSREAIGAAAVADNQWHHAAAVFERDAQRLSLYLDGSLDTRNALPAEHNPADIAGIGRSTAARPLCLGGPGATYQGFGRPEMDRFIGGLAEVSVHRGALKPDEFSYRKPIAKQAEPRPFAPVGTYQTSLCDWGQPAALDELTVEAVLNGGEVQAIIEVSNDRFQSVSTSQKIGLREGKNTYPLTLPSSHHARVQLELRSSGDGTASPAVHCLTLVSHP